MREDPGAHHAAIAAEMDRRTAALAAELTEIFDARMCDQPMVNQALHVQEIGFQPDEGGFLGVLVALWFLNLICLPYESRPALKSGEKEVIRFASGNFEILRHARDLVRPCLACLL